MCSALVGQQRMATLQGLAERVSAAQTIIAKPSNTISLI
jgi:hypothetical protein